MSDAHLKPILETHGLIVHRNGKKVLQIDHLSVHEGETLALIGPNGAGKSSLFLALSHLISPTSGEIVYRGKLVSNQNDLTYRRKIALVLQDPLLLDGSVLQNVMTGLRFRGIPHKEAKMRAEEWIDRLEIGHLKTRRSKQLSGGESQRVSLARAFVISPDILMLDEPFGALDHPTRTSLLEDLREVLSETQMTTIFITHDMDEALMFGDRVAVLVDGDLRQVGPPEQVFSNPVDVDVAALVGVENALSGEVTHHEEGNLIVDTCGVSIEAVGRVEAGREVMLFIRPEDVTLWMGENLPVSSARNRLSGTIQRITIQGPLMKVVLECPGCERNESVRIVALVTRSSGREMSLAEGVDVTATFKASAVHMIPR